MALDANDLLARMDSGFGEMRQDLHQIRSEGNSHAEKLHSRITDLGEKLAAHVAAPCPDVKEHIGVYHRRCGDDNGNGGGRKSYEAAHPDTFRAGSAPTLKLWSAIVGVIIGTAAVLEIMRKFMGG